MVRKTRKTQPTLFSLNILLGIGTFFYRLKEKLNYNLKIYVKYVLKMKI